MILKYSFTHLEVDLVEPLAVMHSICETCKPLLSVSSVIYISDSSIPVGCTAIANTSRAISVPGATALAYHAGVTPTCTAVSVTNGAVSTEFAVGNFSSCQWTELLKLLIHRPFTTYWSSF